MYTIISSSADDAVVDWPEEYDECPMCLAPSGRCRNGCGQDGIPAWLSYALDDFTDPDPWADYLPGETWAERAVRRDAAADMAAEFGGEYAGWAVAA